MNLDFQIAKMLHAFLVSFSFKQVRLIIIQMKFVIRVLLHNYVVKFAEKLVKIFIVSIMKIMVISSLIIYSQF